MEKEYELSSLDHQEEFTQLLIAWFRQEGRILPWRETTDPYHILVSEVMLQQTQVKTVIPYYLRFIETLPDLVALKEASEDTLHHLWEGLGYYSRVKRLQQFAYRVVTEYNGVIPSDKSVLLSLPGIGPYTAGAILSFCYHIVEPAMDGNVKRVLSRLLSIEEDVTKTGTHKELESALIKLLPQNIYPFNQGMIELGALYCTPQNPKCDQCPVQKFCLAFQRELTDRIPLKIKKTRPGTMHVPMIILQQDEDICFVKRETTGLLASLWGIPMVQEDFCMEGDWEEKMRQNLCSWLSETLNLGHELVPKEQIEFLGKAKHVFSSVIWEEFIFYCNVNGVKEKLSILESPQIKWAKHDGISLPTAFKRALRCLDDKG